MKKIIFILLTVSLLSCSPNKSKDFSITDHIPKDSELVVLIPNMTQFFEDLNQNTFLSESDFPLKQKTLQQLAFLKQLKFKNEIGLAISKLSSDTFIYTLITKRDSSLIPFDAIQNKTMESFTEGEHKYQKISIDNNTFYLAEIGSSAILSNSKQKMLDMNKEEMMVDSENFNKAVNASDSRKLSLLINHTRLDRGFSEFFSKLNFPGFNKIADWSILDLDLTESELKVNGISLHQEDKSLLQIFSNTNAQQTEIGKICPVDFSHFYSISSSSFQMLYQGKSQDSTLKAYPEILDHTREIANITLENGSATALNIHEIEAAKETLAGLGEEIESFRGNSIIKMNDEIKFSQIFPELMEIPDSDLYTIQENFVIFSSTIEVLKSFISAFQNSNTLANKAYFTDLMGSLSSESSMLFIINPAKFEEKYKDNKNNLKFNRNSLAAFQLIHERSYAHLHGIFSNSKATTKSNGAKQMAAFKIEAPISTTPQFFRNHRSDQMDIAIQDENNVLHLLSNKGNEFWKSEMDSQITSPIYQIDLFKNGNYQLAFSTGYNFEVIDRNGKKVKGFPITFKEPLTMPLSVFDYDNNRTYRFVLTQNEKVYMVGPKGNAIKGFGFEKAASKITGSPKHIRLGNKDYILIAEESGKLNILSRQGKIRVPVKEKLEFSENDWFGYQNSFVSTLPSNNLVKISQNGMVSLTNLGLAENNRIVADRQNLVYLNENELSINHKVINLDFGLYTDPQLFNLKNRTLIAITDLQTHKVYVYNDKAELLEGFPIYGNSQVDIANADLDSKTELIVRSESDEILLYEF